MTNGNDSSAPLNAALAEELAQNEQLVQSLRNVQKAFCKPGWIARRLEEADPDAGQTLETVRKFLCPRETPVDQAEEDVATVSSADLFY